MSRGSLVGTCNEWIITDNTQLQIELLDHSLAITQWSRRRHMSVKRALVCGAGGFIGSHLVKSLKQDGYWVRGVDLKYPEFSLTAADDFVIADLRERESWERILDVHVDEAYQLAADMGGAGYIFTREKGYPERVASGKD